MDRRSVLIIKHGFSETCDHAVSATVSYGDVFRCTCLLEDFKGCHVTWISAKAAEDVLAGNHLIDSLILADTPSEIPPGHMRARYDKIINLEKSRDWRQFAAAFPANLHYGFQNSDGDDASGFFPASAQALAAVFADNPHVPVQHTLFRTCGREWNGQRYVLGYRPRVAPIYDIGLNNHVGPKWPTKVWPDHLWQALYDHLSQHYAVCWQQSLDSVRHYIDWLASCRVIISSDSLGLHLSLALRKKVVALFGPTPAEQVYMYGCGVKLTPTCQRSCIPCFRSQCDFPESCMEHISVDMVVEAVDMLLGAKEVVTEPMLESVAESQM